MTETAASVEVGKKEPASNNQKPSEKMVPERDLLAVKGAAKARQDKLEGEISTLKERLRDLESQDRLSQFDLKEGTDEEIAKVKKGLLQWAKQVQKDKADIEQERESLSGQLKELQREKALRETQARAKEEYGVDVPMDVLEGAEDVEKAALNFCLQKLKAGVQNQEPEKEKEKPKKQGKFEAGTPQASQKPVSQMTAKEFEEYRRKLVAEANKRR